MKKNIVFTSLFLLLCPSYSDSNFYSQEYTPLDHFKEENTLKEFLTSPDHELFDFTARNIGEMVAVNAGLRYFPTPKGNYRTYGIKKGLQMNTKNAVKGVGDDIVNFRKGFMHPVNTGKYIPGSVGQVSGQVTQFVGKGVQKIGAKSAGKGVEKIGEKIATKSTQIIEKQVAKEATARAGAEAAKQAATRAGAEAAKQATKKVAKEATKKVAKSLIGRGLAGATGVGTVVVLGITAVEGLKALGEGLAYTIEKKNCHKLCSARVVEYARQVGATGFIDWDHIEANVLGDTYGKDKRYCQCKYTGTHYDLYDIRNQEFYLDQLEQRGPLGKVYKQMCAEGRRKRGLGLLGFNKAGDCDSRKTVCLSSAPPACMYVKADD